MLKGVGNIPVVWEGWDGCKQRRKLEKCSNEEYCFWEEFRVFPAVPYHWTCGKTETALNPFLDKSNAFSFCFLTEFNLIVIKKHTHTQNTLHYRQLFAALLVFCRRNTWLLMSLKPFSALWSLIKPEFLPRFQGQYLPALRAPLTPILMVSSCGITIPVSLALSDLVQVSPQPGTSFLCPIG